MKRFEKIFLVLFLFLLSLVPFLWLSKGQLILGYDAVFPLNPTAFLLDRIYSWTSTQGFTMDQSGVQGSLIIHFIDSIPYFLGFSSTSAEKIVFSFWFFAIIFSAYIFAIRIEKSGIIKSRYLRYFFPVLYAFNFYMLQGWWAIERTKFSLVVALPLIFSIILPMIKEKISVGKMFRNSILCSLILTILNGGGWGGLPLYGGLIVALGCFLIFYSCMLILSNRRRDIIYLFLFNFLFIVFYMLLNAYTFFPFISTVFSQYRSIVNDVGGVSGVLSWTRYLSENTSLINLLRLQGIPDWYNNLENHSYASIYLTNPIFIFFSFIFPMFLFASFIKIKKENKSMHFFFLFLLLVSLFFSAGTHKPFGFIFELLMKHVPGFIIFRSPIFKFGYAYWFAASFLIGITLSSVIEYFVAKTQKYKLGIVVGIFLPILVISAIVLYHFPYLTGNIFNIEKTSVSSRVKVPAYVYNFSKWWREKEGNNRILLLPKLNDNWLFDQYKWNYMSLFPLLGNFASENIVVNSAMLFQSESDLLNGFYSSIDKQDYVKMDSFAEILGIRYFLIRKDFYYDLSDQETDNPVEIEVKLQGNPNIKKVISFGEWIIYAYQKEKPFIFVKNNAVLSEGGNLPNLSEIKNNSLILDPLSYIKDPRMFSDIFILPSCSSCLAEKESVSVTFPKSKILADSTLYQFLKIKNKLQMQKQQSIANKALQSVGDTLKYASQINALITQDKSEKSINIIKSEYIRTLNVLFDDVPNIFSKAQNPYDTAIIIQQYLEEEDKYVSEVLTRVNNDSLVLSLQSIIYEINKVKNRLEEIFSEKDFNIKKLYKFHVTASGEYEQRIIADSLGALASNDPSEIKIVIDNISTTSGALIDNENIKFTKQFIEKGDHELALLLPMQKNLLVPPVVENVAGRVCYSSIIGNFLSDKIYRLNFTVSNNFDPTFYFFVDNGDTFSPSLAAYFPLSGNQKEKLSYIISAPAMSLKKNLKTLRVAFCAKSFNEKEYSANVKQLSLVELTSPRVTLHKIENNMFGVLPQISYRRIDQTKYLVEVKAAVNPFYLVFAQRFSSGWHLSEGDHIKGNNFENVWYVNKKGDFVMILEYLPQKYVKNGLAVSLITFFFVITYLFYKRRMDTSNE